MFKALYCFIYEVPWDKTEKMEDRQRWVPHRGSIWPSARPPTCPGKSHPGGQSPSWCHAVGYSWAGNRRGCRNFSGRWWTGVGTSGPAQNCGVALVRLPGLAKGCHEKSGSGVGMLKRASACPRWAGKLLGQGAQPHGARECWWGWSALGGREGWSLAPWANPSTPLTPTCLGASTRNPFPEPSRTSKAQPWTLIKTWGTSVNDRA